MRDERQLRTYVKFTIQQILKEGFLEGFTDWMSDEYGEYFRYRDVADRKKDTKQTFKKIKQFFTGVTIDDVIEKWIESQEEEREVDIPDSLRDEIYEYGRSEFERRMKRPNAKKEKSMAGVVNDMYNKFNYTIRDLRNFSISDDNIVKIVSQELESHMGGKLKKDKQKEFVTKVKSSISDFKRAAGIRTIEDQSDARNAVQHVIKDLVAKRGIQDYFED